MWAAAFCIQCRYLIWAAAVSSSRHYSVEAVQSAMNERLHNRAVKASLVKDLLTDTSGRNTSSIKVTCSFNLLISLLIITVTLVKLRDTASGPKGLSTLSHKSETVAENGETTAKFGDCRTFLWQCGQAIRRFSHTSQYCGNAQLAAAH